MKNRTKTARYQDFPTWGIEKLINLIEKVAAGDYSSDLAEFTRAGQSEAIRRIAEAFGMMMVEIEARECYLAKLNEELRKLNTNMQKNVIQTVTTIAHSLGARDKYSEGHAQRVSLYSKRLAARLKLPSEEVENIKIGGMLHDIGKIGFSDRVFRNEDKNPTRAILREIKKHPVKGKTILKDLHFLSAIINFVYCHHEREDGTGYPRGLHGDKIPLGAKIIGIADTYDALTTDRPYQKARSQRQAFAILRRMRGKGFDPKLIDAFIAEMRGKGS